MASLHRLAVWVTAVLLVPACSGDPTIVPGKGDFTRSDRANGALGVAATPTFDGEASFSIETPSYAIQVSTNLGFVTFVINHPGLMATSFTPGAPLSDGILYSLQVLALRSPGTVLTTGSRWTFAAFSPTPGPFTMIIPTKGGNGRVGDGHLFLVRRGGPSPSGRTLGGGFTLSRNKSDVKQWIFLNFRGNGGGGSGSSISLLSRACSLEQWMRTSAKET